MTLLPCSACCPCPTVTKRDGNPYPTSIDVDITCTGWGDDAWFFAEYFGCGLTSRTWAFGQLRSAPSSGVYSLNLVGVRRWAYFSRFVGIVVEILSESELDWILREQPAYTCIGLASIWVGVNGRQQGERGRFDQFINCNNPPTPAAYTKSELGSLASNWDTQLSIVTYCRHRSPVPAGGCGAVSSHTTYASYGNRPSDSINGQSSATPLQSPAIPATWQTSRLGLEWWNGFYTMPYASAGPNGQTGESAATLVINSVVAHYSDGVDRNVFDI